MNIVFIWKFQMIVIMKTQYDLKINQITYKILIYLTDDNIKYAFV